MTQPSQPTVAIAGGGLAGLSAACALADSGFHVTVIERRPFLGGRASSYEHPGTGEVVDNCQHVLFGCCTNLIEFYRRIGVEDKIRWYDRMTFLEPGGRASELAPSSLPAPLHTAPAFLRLKFLNASDKLSIARAMSSLVPTVLRDSGESFLSWLQRHRQTARAIHRFWEPVLVSALSEDLDRVSVSAAAQVVRVSMQSPAARLMGVPSIPLTDLYHAAQTYITSRGGQIQFRSSLDAFHEAGAGLNTGAGPATPPVRLQINGNETAFDYLILALPYAGLARVLPLTPESQSLREKIEHFESAPITGIHLWFDRQISELDHAILLDRTIQWMFHKSRIQARERGLPDEERDSINQAASGPEPSYVELVVSASKSLIDKSRAEIVEMAVRELREFFPAAREANLMKSTVIKEVHATYSPRPGIDAYRPTSQTLWPRIFLAGDWTATGWPATMEGAVRSGYLAAEALLRSAGLPKKAFLVADLPASGFMRLFE